MDETQFEQVAASLRDGMLAAARRYLHDAAEAEDVVQDVLVRLWKMSERLEPDIKNLSQVLTRNLAIDRLRHQRPHEAIDGLTFAVSPEDSEDPRYERISKLISRLPDDWQTVFRLRHADGMSYADIARLTGITEASARQIVSRARRTLLQQYRLGSINYHHKQMNDEG